MTIWIVREEIDKTEGRGGMRVVAYCSTEEAADEINQSIDGVMGVPASRGGTISKATMDEYPADESLVYGYRKGWDGKWGYGWVDYRDAPETDPEWSEYVRLREKFSS